MTLSHSLDKPQVISWNLFQVMNGVCTATKLIVGVELSHHAVRSLPQPIQGQVWSTYHPLPHCGSPLALVPVICSQEQQVTYLHEIQQLQTLMFKCNNCLLTQIMC